MGTESFPGPHRSENGVAGNRPLFLVSRVVNSWGARCIEGRVALGNEVRDEPLFEVC